jgi:predicted HD superfamily hydrolase involved in NAD metabolism
MLRQVKKHRLKIPGLDFILKYSPNMMHAYVGADAVRRKGWIKKKNDLMAIASHTLGREKMSLEEQILFIADFSAPGRTYSCAEMIREIALKDLRQGFRETLRNKIGWYLKKDKMVHPMSIVVWNQICKAKA